MGPVLGFSVFNVICCWNNWKTYWPQSCSSAISDVDDRRLDELLGDGIKGQLITENKVSSKILATMLIKIVFLFFKLLRWNLSEAAELMRIRWQSASIECEWISLLSAVKTLYIDKSFLKENSLGNERKLKHFANAKKMTPLFLGQDHFAELQVCFWKTLCSYPDQDPTKTQDLT